MDTGLGWEGNRLVVQRTSDPLTATLYIVKSGPIASEKKMAPLDALKSVHTQFTFYLYILAKKNLVQIATQQMKTKYITFYEIPSNLAFS